MIEFLFFEISTMKKGWTQVIIVIIPSKNRSRGFYLFSQCDLRLTINRVRMPDRPSLHQYNSTIGLIMSLLSNFDGVDRKTFPCLTYLTQPYLIQIGDNVQGKVFLLLKYLTFSRKTFPYLHYGLKIVAIFSILTCHMEFMT